MNAKNNVDKQYLELLNYILKNGVKKSDRTGTGTLSVFDYTLKFNISEGFPALTSKKVYLKGVIHELLWFLNGDTNIKYLVDNDVNIWNGDAFKHYTTNVKFDSTGKWCKSIKNDDNEYYHPEPYTKKEFIEKIKIDQKFADKWGELGPIYGSQWRYWEHMSKKEKESQAIGLEGCVNEHIDQIEVLIETLKTNPDSRRLIVSAWNVADLDSMTLVPCHYVFQCYTQELSLDERIELGYKLADPFDWDLLIGNTSEQNLNLICDEQNIPKRKLSLKWNQRSVDVFLGLPFNIVSYAILLEILAKEVNMVPHELIFSGGDVHLYLNHIDQAKEQLTRETFELPKLEFSKKEITDYRYEDFNIINYKSAGILKGELSN